MRNVLCLLLFALAWPALAALGDKQTELKDLRGRIDQLREELERTSEDHAEVADALKKSERQISTVNRKLRDLGQDERRLNAELNRLQAESNRIKGELRDQQERLGNLFRQRYYQGGEDGLRLMLSGRHPDEIVRNLHYYSYIGQARANLITAQRETIAQLAILQAETEKQKLRLADLRTERQAQKQALQGVKSARESMLGKLSSQIRQQRKEIKTLQQDEARLARLIERLRKLASTSQDRQQGRAPWPEGRSGGQCGPGRSRLSKTKGQAGPAAGGRDHRPIRPGA